MELQSAVFCRGHADECVWIRTNKYVQKNSDQVGVYLHLPILTITQEMPKIFSKFFQNSCFEKTVLCQ